MTPPALSPSPGRLLASSLGNAFRPHIPERPQNPDDSTFVPKLVGAFILSPHKHYQVFALYPRLPCAKTH